MKALIVIFFFTIVFASTLTTSYRASQLYQIEPPPNQWTDSVNRGKGMDNPGLFKVIGGVQKLLDDRNIGIHLFGGRYELCYKRIY